MTCIERQRNRWKNIEEKIRTKQKERFKEIINSMLLNPNISLYRGDEILNKLLLYLEEEK